MHIQKKQLLGFGGLALVAGITAFAYNLPTSATSVSGNVAVGVTVYNNVPDTVIESPLDGGKFTTNNLDFKEIHSRADNVKYYLTSLDEDGNPTATYELTAYEVIGTQVSGTTQFTLDLNSYGGFGKYIFKSVVTSTGGTDEDAVQFEYIAIDTPDDQVEDDGEGGGIDIEICYAAGTRVLTMGIFTKDGRNLVKRLPDYITQNPTTGCCETITIDPEDINIESGEYIIVVDSYDNDEKQGDPTGTVIIRFKHTAPAPHVPDTPDAPNVPDTGALLSALNISKGDFLITGVLGFTIISVIALFVIKRANSKK